MEINFNSGEKVTKEVSQSDEEKELEEDSFQDMMILKMRKMILLRKKQLIIMMI